MRPSVRALALALPLLAACSRCAPQPQPPPQPPPGPGASAAAPTAPEAAGAPFGLTASDGTGLSLVRLGVAAVVRRPLAFTELRLTFENPTERVLEGRFHITLPTGAAVSRFAMRVGELWQEGEMVELRLARRTYEDFLHRRQDPALLEQAAGNEFAARVFPIPARGRKELVLSFTQELSGREPWRVPLRGLPAIGEYEARVLVHEGGAPRVVEARQKSWRPDADLEVAAAGEGPRALRSGRFVVARVSPQLPADPEEIDSLAVLVDTSASRALGFGRQVELVRELVAAVPPSAPVLVAAFDQEVEVVYEGAARAFGEEALGKLRARKALGATDLGFALRWLQEKLAARPLSRALVVGDGVLTAGDPSGEALGRVAQGLAKAGVQRLDAVVVGGIRAPETFTRLARAGFAREGVVADDALPPAEIARRLKTAAKSGLKVEVPGADWVRPETLDGVQPGDEVLVHAELPEGRPLEVRVDGKALLSGVEPAAADAALVAPACAAAKISALGDKLAALPAEDAAGRAALKAEIVGLSTAHRVSSPYTALLVLETEDDYKRYGIARESLGQIWTVADNGLRPVERRVPADALALRQIVEDEARRAEEARTGVKPTPAPEAPPTARDGDTARAERKADEAAPAPSGGDAERREELRRKVAAKGLLSIIGATGTSGGAMDGVFEQGALEAPEGVAVDEGAPAAEAAAPAEEPPAPPRAAAPASPPARPAEGGIASLLSGSHAVGDVLGEAAGVGGLGARGGGLGGGGLGSSVNGGLGRGGIASSRAGVSVVAPDPVVTGSLAPEVVRRVVRQHLNAVKYCYERQLMRDPTLSGRLVLQWVVGPSGAVSDVAVPEDTLTPRGAGAEAVTTCVRMHVQRWRFPAPAGGGRISIRYPFTFHSDGAAGPTPARAPTGPSVALEVADLDGAGVTRARLEELLVPLREPLLACRADAVRAGATLPEELRFEVRLGIDPTGAIVRAGFEPREPASLVECLQSRLRAARLELRAPDELAAVVRIGLSGREPEEHRPPRREGVEPYTGKFGEILRALGAGERAAALQQAAGWREEAPGDVLALVALGEACEAGGDKARAARAYGSIADLFPARADLRRFAANRLERLGDSARGLALAQDGYRKAAEQRPDHATSHHLLGIALLREGKAAEAFDAFAAGLARSYPSGRFRGAERVLAEDLGLAAAAWKKAEPKRAAEIEKKLREAKGEAETEPSLRFLLTWETDANDVDFHIHDSRGGHAYYSAMHLPSGGDLYADVTTGYGPECFTIRNPPEARADPYWLEAHYYSRGPMGYGMGKLDVVEHDGKGGLRFETRPFVVMNDHAYVDLGRVGKPLRAVAGP